MLVAGGIPSILSIFAGECSGAIARLIALVVGGVPFFAYQ